MKTKERKIFLKSLPLSSSSSSFSIFQGSKDSDRRDLTGCDVKHCDTNRSSSRDVDDDDDRGRGGGGAGGDEGGGSTGLVVREIHSCPSSPTETECSSGFSTLRRRSVTLTEKVRGTKREGGERRERDGKEREKKREERERVKEGGKGKEKGEGKREGEA